MKNEKRFSNLGTTACSVVYAANALLILGLLILSVFALPIWLWTFLYALQDAGNGRFSALAVLAFILLWLIASFGCFIGVISITAWKKRWIWILQFLPFATAIAFYLIVIIAGHF